MACQFEVLLGGGQKAAGTEAALAALDLVESLESQLTIFRNTSEISRINQTAHLEPMPVEPRYSLSSNWQRGFIATPEAPTTLLRAR